LIQFAKSAFAVAAVLGCAGSAARGAERVTLANGFAQICHHHEMIDGRLRLDLTADGTSYIEYPPAEIAAIEAVPDPPAPEAEEANAAEPAKSKLTPADLHEMLASAGQANHLDEDLLASVVKAESGGNPRATSRAGAKGLMQLMPGTASDEGVVDIYRPDQNVKGGSAYLDALLSRYHDNLSLALAAYNAGPGAVDKYHVIPPYRETRRYVARVIHEFNRRVRARELAKQDSARALGR
jgi:soluble lytic murein transglycosylase-like protein